MKKLIFLFAFLLVTLASNAKLLVMQTTHFKLSHETYWTPSDIKVTWNTNTKRITIFTVQRQIIDYVTTDVIEESNWSSIFGKGTDSNYKVMNFYFILNNDQLYLTIEYSDISYSYKLNIVN